MLSSLLCSMILLQAAEKKPEQAIRELWYSVERGYLQGVHLALSKGATINMSDNKGETPLHVASKNSSSSIVRLLLIHKAPLEAKDTHGNTPLALVNNEPGLLILLNNGAAINARNAKGETAALLAARTGQMWKLKILINYGADICAADNNGDTIFTAKVTLRRSNDQAMQQKELDQYVRELKKEIHKAAKSPKPLSEHETNVCESQTPQERAQSLRIPIEVRGIPEEIAGYLVGELSPQERAELQQELIQTPSASSGPQTKE